MSKDELDSIKAYHLAKEILDSHLWIKKITIKTASGSATVWRDE
jgi:hypothetical protein